MANGLCLRRWGDFNWENTYVFFRRGKRTFGVTIMLRWVAVVLTYVASGGAIGQMTEGFG